MSLDSCLSVTDEGTCPTCVHHVPMLPREGTEAHLPGPVQPPLRVQRHDGAEGCMQARQRVAEGDVGAHRRPVWVAIEVPAIIGMGDWLSARPCQMVRAKGCRPPRFPVMVTVIGRINGDQKCSLKTTSLRRSRGAQSVTEDFKRGLCPSWEHWDFSAIYIVSQGRPLMLGYANTGCYTEVTL